MIADLEEAQRRISISEAFAKELSSELITARKKLAESERRYSESVGGFKRDLQQKLDDQRSKSVRLKAKLAAAQARERHTRDTLNTVLGLPPGDSSALDAAIAEAVEPYRKDAERYRWLTNDHDSPDTRKACHDISARIPVMSYSAVSQAIDAAIAAKVENE